MTAVTWWGSCPGPGSPVLGRDVLAYMSNLTLDRPIVSRTASVRAPRPVPAATGSYTGAASVLGSYAGTASTVGAYTGRAPRVVGSYVRTEH